MDGHTRRLLTSVLAVLLTTGCGFCTSPTEGPTSKVPAQCQGKEPLIEPQKLDILFLVDNSSSMADEQRQVATQLTAFIDEVRKGGGVAQDFNVGVITTSIYQNALRSSGASTYTEYPTQSGKLQPVPDAAGDGGVILGTGTERVLTGEDPELISKFARLVQVGTGGSGQETPFEALRLAFLSDLASVPLEQGGNHGFLRDRARLLIVLVTDEDDCSERVRPAKVTVGDLRNRDYCHEQTALLTPVSEYHRLLTEELKDSTGAVREIVFAAIGPVGRTNKEVQEVVGPEDAGMVLRNIDCPTSVQPGRRVKDMASQFDPTLANLDSICKENYRDTLVAIAGLANISQTLEISNVPDPSLLHVRIIRRDGSNQDCTRFNGGLTAFDEASAEQPARVHFGGECRRRADDREVQIKLLCAG
jgi:hypothetical protein